MSFIDGESRDQVSLLPACVDDHVSPGALVRVVDVFVASLDLTKMGFARAAAGRPGHHPGELRPLRDFDLTGLLMLSVPDRR